MTTLFEGTFSELQRRLSTFQVPQEKIVRLEITDDLTSPNSESVANPPYGTEDIRLLIDALDEEEARDAYRIARH